MSDSPVNQYDHRRKLDRAGHHLHALDALIQGFTDLDPYEIRAEFDPKTGYYHFRLHSCDHFPPEHSPIIGDVLFNLRSALDQLAFSLNLKGGTLARPERSEFPIYDSPTDFTANVRFKIPNVGPRPLAIIESLQPYPGRKGMLLRMLSDLCVVDKHRLLHVVNVATDHTSFGATERGRGVFDMSDMRFFAAVVEDGAEVVRVRPGKRGVVPQAEMYVECHLQCKVCFGQSPDAGMPNPAARLPVSDTLRRLRDYVRDQVVVPLESFL